MSYTLATAIQPHGMLIHKTSLDVKTIKVCGTLHDHIIANFRQYVIERIQSIFGKDTRGIL